MYIGLKNNISIKVKSLILLIDKKNNKLKTFLNNHNLAIYRAKIFCIKILTKI